MFRSRENQFASRFIQQNEKSISNYNCFIVISESNYVYIYISTSVVCLSTHKDFYDMFHYILTVS